MITNEYIKEMEDEVYTLHLKITQLREENNELKEAIREILSLVNNLPKCDERETIITICEYLTKD